MNQINSKKDQKVVDRATKSGRVTIADELSAIDCIEYIQNTAALDCVACEQCGISHYKFWSVRQQRAEIATLYQFASDARAQHYVDRSVNDIDKLAAELRGGELERSAAHALVSLARTQHQASLRYAELSDRKRWGAKIELAAGEDFDFASLIERAREIRRRENENCNDSIPRADTNSVRNDRQPDL